MRNAIVILTIAYILSQFYRAFLAVLVQPLSVDIGTTPADLAQASGVWFLVFAAMQIPVGWALDNVGPRRSTAIMFALGAGLGSIFFGLATQPWHITAAMALIGIGCAPILMASYFVIARNASPAVFATLAAVVIAVGNIGNIGAARPMTILVEASGWRNSMFILAAVCLVISVFIWFVVTDPKKSENADQGRLRDLFRIPQLWIILAFISVYYSPVAGLRGLWISPYLQDVFGASAADIGNTTFVMGIAMIAGTFFFGPLDRIFGTRKWVIFTGTFIVVLPYVYLLTWGASSILIATICFAVVGFFGSAFPVIVAHGRAFVPEHLTGRGMTLINLFGVGAVGVFQIISGHVYDSVASGATTSTAPYTAVFALFGVCLMIGLAIYGFSRDRTD